MKRDALLNNYLKYSRINNVLNPAYFDTEFIENESESTLNTYALKHIHAYNVLSLSFSRN